jgi:phosphoribosyl-AMP cyclohydrolase
VANNLTGSFNFSNGFIADNYFGWRMNSILFVEYSLIQAARNYEAQASHEVFEQAMIYFCQHSLERQCNFEDIILKLIRTEVKLLDDKNRKYKPNDQLETLSLLKLFEIVTKTKFPAVKVKELLKEFLKAVFSSEEKNATKQSIISGILNNEIIDQEIRNEVIEGIVRKFSEVGILKKIISVFSGSKKMPNKLEELVYNLIQDQKSVLMAIFNDKDSLHETLKTWMENYHVMRDFTKARLDNIKEKLRIFVTQMSSDTLSYAEFKIIVQKS